MANFIIRNDDVCVSTKLSEITKLCETCDKYGYQLLHAIVPIGDVQKITSGKMTNDQIRTTSSKLFSENKNVLNFLLKRKDLIGVHGLWHTHSPTLEEINFAKLILQGLGFKPEYFVPPFNEGGYPEKFNGLNMCSLSRDNGDCLEDYLRDGIPNSDMVYMHSWRFNDNPYSFEMLEQCLRRLSGEKSVKLNLGCKHRILEGFDNLDRIFGWYFQHGLPQYQDNSVDAITISHALMFLTDTELATFSKEMWRVLKSGGVVRITEDDTENPKSDTFGTGCLSSTPRCLTGPKMMRKVLENTGFTVRDVDETTTYFGDNSLLQNYHKGRPRCFFIEGIKIIN